ncbi:alpha/beta fold hydrolase [Massilia buxea]|nr:alpha/beta fold hydrolase [Pseudoduganella buxea]
MNFIRQALVACAVLAFGNAHAAPAFKADITGQGQGQGPAVILIPGLASSGDVWQGTVRHLCGPRQCHVLTLAGFAGQPPIDGPLLPQVERQLADYIDANGLGKPVIIGHSLGGFIGLKFAIGHPDKLSRLVVVDALPALGATQVPDVTPDQLRRMADGTRAAVLGQDEAAAEQSRRATIATMVAKPEDAERIAEWGRRSHRATVAGAMYELMSTDLRADVARVRTPTLVLGTWVAYKAFAPRAAIEQTYRSQYAKLPGVRIEMADTARHFIMADDPAWLYDRLDQFIQ